jgi:steroid delta-isomerase-like uncharacterized protein
MKPNRGNQHEPARVRDRPGRDWTMTAETTSQRSGANEVADRYLDAWNAHDLDTLGQCLADDVVYDVPGQPEPLRGRAAVVDWARSTFTAMPDFHVDERERWIAADGSTVATQFSCAGTFNGGRIEPPGFSPTGERLEIPGMDRIELRETKIVRAELYWDMVAIGQRIGAVPPPGSIGERLGVAVQRLTARRRQRKVRS